MCPVCKTSTYLDHKMTFLVNTECYHKMCNSCVDRLFGAGPAPCPVAGCGRTLRAARFKKPRFEDLAVEHECDVRARVAAVLNLREADFETLRAYNDYEEWREDVVFALVGGGPRAEEMELLLRRHARENKDKIARNAEAERREREAVFAAERERNDRSARGREEALRELQEERAERDAERKGRVDRIAGTTSGFIEFAQQGREERKAANKASKGDGKAVKQQQQQQTDQRAAKKQVQSQQKHSSAAAPAFNIPGLKKTAAPAPEAPYDPFAGLHKQTRYHVPSGDGYYHPWSNAAKDRVDHAAAGYLPETYQRQAVHEACAGLGVFIAKEKGKAGA